MYNLWCQPCCWENHPMMMTTYTIAGVCDRCGRRMLLAIVKPA